ncbi:hypothetical protein [Roseivivax sediminis]|uniref:hypothetical protein n=1 Tax=Roseivivax sediminis TaxID=936889 RepID=UPI00122C9A7D|nr:hypothetical protein [Roseivivax sediminis]
MCKASFLSLALCSLPLVATAQQNGSDSGDKSTSSGPFVIEDAAWSDSVERGLSVHDLEASGAAVQLVCDPDRVFGPKSNGSFAVALPSGAQPTQIVVLAQNGEQAALQLTENRAAQMDTNPDQWSALVAILQENTEFAVVSSDDAVTWQVEAPISGPCE